MTLPKKPQFKRIRVLEGRIDTHTTCHNTDFYYANFVDAWVDDLFRNAVRVTGAIRELGHFFSELDSEYDTHQAWLVGVENLPCKHEGMLTATVDKYKNTWEEFYKCRHCGQKLRARWEVVDEQIKNSGEWT